MSDEPVRSGDLAPDVTVAQPVPHAAEDLVPAWLAALVLVLLLAVFGVGGYLIRDRLVDDGGKPMTTEQLAIDKARDGVEAAPEDPQAHLDLGYAYQRDGRYQQALDQYAAVLKRDPRNTAALYNRGMVFLRLDKPKEAEAALWQVLNVNKTHVLAAKALGDLYAQRKQYRPIIVAVQPAADARPDMADLQALLGLAYEKIGDSKNAYAHYLNAVRYVPDLPEAREGLRRLEGRQ